MPLAGFTPDEPKSPPELVVAVGFEAVAAELPKLNDVETNN